MYRIAIAVAAVLAVLATIIVRYDFARFLLSDGVPQASTAETTKAPSPPNAGLPRAVARDTKQPDQPRDRQSLTFDVARIDPEGASVFAGQAPPNSQVTILANGEPVAEATADASGAWVAITERKFPPAEYEFSLRAKSAERKEVTEGQRARVVLAPTARPGAPPQVFAAATLQAKAAAPTLKPITFVYNEATLTPEGRKAVGMLAEHLMSQRSQSVSLSGHADERGSDQYNLELSRQRLDVVAGYLRSRGFSGQLELLAKGKSEPFGEIDRRSLSKDDVFQLDRRVQLRLAR